MADDVAEADQRDRRRAAEHRVGRLAATLERHPHPVGAFVVLEAFHIDDAGQRGGEVAQRAGFLLGQRHQFVDALHLEIGIHHQHLDDVEQVDDGRELVRIEGQLLEQELVVGDRVDADDADRVAVGRRFGQARAAMLPAPPGRLSMISGWPIRLFTASPSARMKTSLKPPAPEVVKTWIGLSDSRRRIPAPRIKAAVRSRQGHKAFHHFLPYHVVFRYMVPRLIAEPVIAALHPGPSPIHLHGRCSVTIAA